MQLDKKKQCCVKVLGAAMKIEEKQAYLVEVHEPLPISLSYGII